jgi:hypothetical protein
LQPPLYFPSILFGFFLKLFLRNAYVVFLIDHSPDDIPNPIIDKTGKNSGIWLQHRFFAVETTELATFQYDSQAILADGMSAG